MNTPTDSVVRQIGSIEPLGQGDILNGVKCIDALDSSGTDRQVMVISYSCEIDKPETKACYAAVIRHFGTKEREKQKQFVRDGKVANVFHLPASDVLGDEALVDFRSIYRIPFAAIGADLSEAADGPPQRMLTGSAIRIGGLTEVGVKMLHGHLVFFFCRLKLPSALAA